MNIELGKTNRLKALPMIKIILEINKLCVNKPGKSMKERASAKINSRKKSLNKQTALDKAVSNIK